MVSETSAASRSSDNSAVTILPLTSTLWQQTRSFFDRCLNRHDVATRGVVSRSQRAGRCRKPLPFTARRWVQLVEKSQPPPDAVTDEHVAKISVHKIPQAR